MKAPSPRGIPRETKQGYILTLLTFFLSFFLTYVSFGQAYEEEEEWQRVERTTERGGGGGGGGERLKKNRNELRSSSEGTRGRARRRRHRRHVGQKSLPPRCRAPREIRPAIVYIEIRSCRNARKWLLARKYLECHASPSNWLVPDLEGEGRNRRFFILSKTYLCARVCVRIYIYTHSPLRWICD